MALVQPRIALRSRDLFLLETLLVGAITTIAAAAALERCTDQQATESYEDSTWHADGDYTVGTGG